MTKRCTKCKVEKPLEEFYRRNKTESKDGRESTCKACENQARNIRRWRRREEERTGIKHVELDVTNFTNPLLEEILAI